MQEKSYDISLVQLLKIAIKRWWIILIAMLICAGAMFGYTKFFTTPSYSSSAEIGVNTDEMSLYQGAIAGQTFATQCSRILEGSITLETAVEYVNLKYESMGKKPPREYSIQVLKNMVSTSTMPDSPYFYLTVTTNGEDIKIDTTGMSKSEAEAAKNAVAREEAKIVCQAVIDAYRNTFATNDDIIPGAKVATTDGPTNATESSSRLVTNVLLGAIIGLVLSWGALIVISFFKDTIESEDWLVSAFEDNIPMLAVIPDATDAHSAYKKYSKKYGYYTKQK